MTNSSGSIWMNKDKSLSQITIRTLLVLTGIRSKYPLLNIILRLFKVLKSMANHDNISLSIRSLKSSSIKPTPYLILSKKKYINPLTYPLLTTIFPHPITPTYLLTNSMVKAQLKNIFQHSAKGAGV